jgi:DeoR/GlpR family transcriptional regulator of sugar metabolism
MKRREKILDYVRKKPMATVEEITGELGINYETVIASLSTLERKGKIKATDSSPAKYVVLPKKPLRGDNGQGFMDYVDGLSRQNQELKAEINRLRGELGECRRKLAKLARRIVRETIYGKD